MEKRWSVVIYPEVQYSILRMPAGERSAIMDVIEQFRQLGTEYPGLQPSTKVESQYVLEMEKFQMILSAYPEKSEMFFEKMESANPEFSSDASRKKLGIRTTKELLELGMKDIQAGRMISLEDL